MKQPKYRGQIKSVGGHNTNLQNTTRNLEKKKQKGWRQEQHAKLLRQCWPLHYRHTNYHILILCDMCMQGHPAAVLHIQHLRQQQNQELTNY